MSSGPDRLQPLSGLDATFLYAETPSTPMNVIATIVLDPHESEARPASQLAARGEVAETRRRAPVGYEDIVARLEQRLPRIPHFRRLLVETPFSLGPPYWVEAPEFELGQHLMRVLARAPGGRGELAEVVAKAAAARLDRSRPLWSLWVVEGLEDGKLALVIRSHHALLDGMSGAALLLQLFDTGEDSNREAVRAPAPSPGRPEPPQPAAGESAAAPSRGELLGRTVTGLPRRVLGVFEAARVAGNAIARIAKDARAGSWGCSNPAMPGTAPRTRFNRPVTAQRSVAYSRVPLGHAKQVQSALGGTVNDVVLAGCASALRKHLRESGDTLDAPLLAAIPVCTRTGTEPSGGNRISAMLVRLPVHEADPLERMLATTAETRLAKRFHRSFGRETLRSLAEMSSPIFTKNALALYESLGLGERTQPFVNLTISCLTGPPTGLRMHGAAVDAIHPHGPLMPGSGLNITVMIYAGSIDIGVLTCSGLIPAPQTLADGIAVGIEQLAKRCDPARLPSFPLPELSKV